MKRYVKNLLCFNFHKGERVDIKRRDSSSIRFGNIVGFKNGKLIVSVFHLGLWYEKSYDYEDISLR